jgi:hypothetical protein
MCTRLVFWSFLFCPNNTVKNLIFRQRFPGLVPLLQWRLPISSYCRGCCTCCICCLEGDYLLLERLLFHVLLILKLQLLLRRSLPGLLRLLLTLLLLERLMYRLLLILMLQQLLRRSLPGLLRCYRCSCYVVLLICSYCCC